MGNAAAVLYGNLNNVFNKRLQIVMIGLDGAGKTTILYRLKYNKEARSTVPTTAFNVETISGKTTILYRLKYNKEARSTVPTTAFNVETISPHKNLKLLLNV